MPKQSDRDGLSRSVLHRWSNVSLTITTLFDPLISESVNVLQNQLGLYVAQALTSQWATLRQERNALMERL